MLEIPKGCALVAYLAATRQTQTREALADLLWEAASTAQGLRNLRALLARIRALVPELHVTRTALAFRPGDDTVVDLAYLQAVLDDSGRAEPTAEDISKLDTALQLYRGDLLAGFSLPDAPRFEEWLVVERERLRQATLSASARLCQTCLECQNWVKGLAAARRWLAIEPFDEAALRAMLQARAALGEPGGAWQQYDAYRQHLWEVLAVEPEPATVALADRIRQPLSEAGAPFDRGSETVAPVDLPAPGPLPPNASLPYAHNPDFVGREADLLHLAEHLLPRQPAATPPTAAITGMGGLGKTQLGWSSPTDLGASFPAAYFGCALPTPAACPRRWRRSARKVVCGSFGRPNIYRWPTRSAGCGAPGKTPCHAC